MEASASTSASSYNIFVMEFVMDLWIWWKCT